MWVQLASIVKGHNIWHHFPPLNIHFLASNRNCYYTCTYTLAISMVTTLCNSKKWKAYIKGRVITTITELVVVWSVCSTVNQSFLWTQLLMQLFMIFPCILQGVEKIDIEYKMGNEPPYKLTHCLSRTCPRSMLDKNGYWTTTEMKRPTSGFCPESSEQWLLKL